MFGNLSKLDRFFVSAIPVAAFFAYWLWKLIYNVYLHPLAKFPGPKWATCSYLAEFYYDIFQGGRYFQQVVKMHEIYGPLVRMNPNDLHINDPYFYEQVYAGNGYKRHKPESAVFDMPLATSSTLDHELHRQRRGYWSNFFSKQSVVRLEPFIQAKVAQMVDKLKEAHYKGDTLIGVEVFGALTTDIISHYAYGESFKQLDQPGFLSALTRDISQILLSSKFRRSFPAINSVMKHLPQQVIERLNPNAKSMFDVQVKMNQLSLDALATRDKVGNAQDGQTIFQALTDPSIPPHERTLERLRDEGLLVLAAGLETTARFLTNTVCYMVTYPGVLSKLRSELDSVITYPDAQPTWTQLETLPYLRAFINESLRFNCCLTDIFPRVPAEPLRYKDWIIPAGTSVGAIPWLLNRHPDVFPDPDVFRPERWLEAEAQGERLTRYLVTFTKGTRICLGINLAYAEMYIMVAALVRNFDMELVDSSIEDIVPYRDYGLSFNKGYKVGVNFKITDVLHK
ncbi:benzoate 4-monooxygenase cytochrome P450 [Pyrenochaeta sp. MPI-SDFR-AT-0127]|nr:benzoate 4-monooxygenase cytochrome P450 [Pyrenochaeta sp. MPI-SDFR-AT-0127]